MRWFFIAVLILFLLDQVAKLLIKGTVNRGAAFGILQGWVLLFVLAGFFVLGFVLYYKDRVKSYGYFGLVLLFSGTLGNLVDRLVFGYVRDFIDVGFWPIFNLADTYNTIGVLLLVAYFWKH